MTETEKVLTHFSHFFEIDSNTLNEYGAFNVSLINDLPLFIDPFLLFNSSKPEYQTLHKEIIKYLRFLRKKSLDGPIPHGLMEAWYTFKEVKQNWLGFSVKGNRGRGLGLDFARSLNSNLVHIFSDFGREQITRGSHLEKLCLIKEGVGKDSISDFTTNLIKEYLLNYTQTFAQNHINKNLLKYVAVEKVKFNYKTEIWESALFELPYIFGDHVILTPKDILTKNDVWINKDGMVNDFDQFTKSISNEALRNQLDNYFNKMLPLEPSKPEIKQARYVTIQEFPELIDYYVLFKENNGEKAVNISSENVEWTENLFVVKITNLIDLLSKSTSFYNIKGNTFNEAKDRAFYLKDIIENKGGWRLLYIDGRPIKKEADLQILYRLTWYSTSSDVSREVNDGRGFADFKISRGNLDKTIVEFKLASNSQLKRNLSNQVEVYKSASDAEHGLHVIFFFSESEKKRVDKILSELSLAGNKNVILIDARNDNKPSGSKA